MSDRQASTFRKGHTDEETRLLAALNTAKIPALWGDAIQIDKDSYLIPDLIVPVSPGLSLGVEVMGAGSKSDDAARHESLLAHGFFPIYLTNSQVNHCPEACVQRIRMTRSILRSLISP